MHNIFKNKFVVNLHHADFDGAISGSCVKAALGDLVINKSTAIKNVKREIISVYDDADIILLTDISIQPDDIDKFKDSISNNKIIIFDHHINEHNKNLFTHLPKTCVSSLKSDICGATLTWLELLNYFPKNKKLLEMEEIVYFSDVYDMWRIENKDFEYAVELNDLLDYEIGYTPDQFREKWLKNPDPFNLSAKDKKIIATKKIRMERVMKTLISNAIIFEYIDMIIVMTDSPSATDYTKMIFMNEVLSSEKVDMFIFKYEGTSQCSVRIPSNSKIEDLNEYYDIFGCVGHAKAGGIQPKDYHKIKKILDTI